MTWLAPICTGPVHSDLARDQVDPACRPNTVPRPSPTTPTAATTTAVVRCDEPECAGSATAATGAAGAGAAALESDAASTGTSTVSLEASLPTSIVDDQLCLPGALASILCGPGSTGIAEPSSAGCTSTPSRWISTVAVPLGAWMVSVDNRDSSAAARCVARS